MAMKCLISEIGHLAVHKDNNDQGFGILLTVNESPESDVKWNRLRQDQ